MGKHDLSSSINKGKRLYYGYIVAAASASLQVIMWGIFNTYGVFFIPLYDEFGWSRAAISGARSLSMVIWGFMSIILGNLNDKFGPKVIMAVCGCFFGVGFFLMSQVNTMWQLYLFYGIIIGIGVSATDVVILSTIARWFVRKRGMMTGIVKVGSGLGMFIMPLMANGLISAYGWRHSFTIFGAIGLISIISIAQLLRRDPGQIQQMPDGEKKLTTINLHSVESGLPLYTTIRTIQLWTTCIMYLAIWFCINIVLVHIAPHAMDIGISATKAAGILSAIGAISIVGRVVIGAMSDRIGCKKSMVICCLIFIVSFLLLQFARGFWTLGLFAVIYGFAHGGFATLISPLVGELFGLRAHGTILGIIIFLGSIGGAVGPIFAGYLFDVTKSYQLAFSTCIAMGVIGLILSITLKSVISRDS